MNDIIIIIITILFSAFFSGMEIAFVSANKMSLELDKKQNTLASGLMNIYTSKPEKYITTMLVGNNISLVIYGLAIANLLEPLIMKHITSDVLILLIQTIISTFIILFTAEFLPKTLFRLNPNGALKYMALPVFLFYIILWPISSFSIFLSRGIIKNLFRKKIDSNSNGNIFTKVDLNHYINQPDIQPANEEKKDENEVRLFKNALDFSKVKVRDCMIPRTEIDAFDIDSNIDLLKTKFTETGHSKILIYQEIQDNIVGYIHTSQLFSNPASIKLILNNIIIVPETMSASKLLGTFTQKHRSIALVVDEFGGTSGLVTTEDILEEIFGEIEDEHDTDDLVFKKVKENEWVISGRSEINYLNEECNMLLPEDEEFDTLAGYILNIHENIPKTNAIINSETYEFRILKASNTKIELVQVKLIEEN